MKTCPKCKELKPLSEYHNDKSSKDGFSCHCKICRTASSRDFSKKNYSKRIVKKESGKICKYCSNPRISHQKVCEKCWYKNKAGTYLADRSKANDLIQLAQSQNYRCIYTNHLLIPGTNMSLDHKISKSKGGCDNISNYQWILTDVNYMKRDLNEQRFLELCKIICDNTVIL